MRKMCSVFLFCLVVSWSMAQQLPVHWTATDSDLKVIKKWMDLPKMADSIQLETFKRALFSKAQHQAYFLVQINIERFDEHFQGTIHLGTPYLWLNVQPEQNAPFLEKPIKWSGKPVRAKQVNQFTHAWVAKAANNGYPFAAVRFQHIQWEENQLLATLSIELGPKITFDTLQIPAKAEVNARFLQSYLNIKQGADYNEREFKAIEARISHLPYVYLSAQPQLSFGNSEAQVYLPLEKRASNSIDALVALAPPIGPDQRAQLSGQVNLELHNLFKSGKYLQFYWQQLRPLSQSLDVQFEYPQLFKAPIDLGLEFQLFKEDTAFLNRKAGWHLAYRLNEKQEIGLTNSFNNSNVISTFIGNQTDLLPNRMDTRAQLWGISYQFSSLNNPILARAGSLIKADIAAGNRVVLVNPSLDPQLYQGLQLNSSLYQIRLQANTHIKTKAKQLIFIQLQQAWLENDQLFQNDLIRIGGLQTIRGFSENSFYASRYAIVNLEYRFLMSNESFVFGFMDASYQYYKVNQKAWEDYPRSGGIGAQLKTGNGLLNIVYAIGVSREQAFSLNFSRVHIGYISRF